MVYRAVHVIYYSILCHLFNSLLLIFGLFSLHKFHCSVADLTFILVHLWADYGIPIKALFFAKSRETHSQWIPKLTQCTLEYLRKYLGKTFNCKLLRHFRLTFSICMIQRMFATLLSRLIHAKTYKCIWLER